MDDETAVVEVVEMHDLLLEQPRLATPARRR
jgi:hypothetical protein